MGDLPAWISTLRRQDARERARTGPYRDAYALPPPPRRTLPRPEDIQALEDQFFRDRAEAASTARMRAELPRLEAGQAQGAPDPEGLTPLQRNAYAAADAFTPFPSAYRAGQGMAHIARGDDEADPLGTAGNAAWAGMFFLPGMASGAREPLPRRFPDFGSPRVTVYRGEAERSPAMGGNIEPKRGARFPQSPVESARGDAGEWVDLYHGSNQEPEDWRGSLWATKSPRAASDYAQSAREGGAPNLRALQGNIESAVTVRSERELYRLLGDDAEVLNSTPALRRISSDRFWELLDAPAVQDALRRRGVSVDHIPNDSSPSLIPHQSYLFLDESRVRTRPNADPARPPPTAPKSLPRRKPPSGGFTVFGAPR